MYHFDFYRFTNQREWMTRAFASTSTGRRRIVEWPEKAASVPRPTSKSHCHAQPDPSELELQLRRAMRAACTRSNRALRRRRVPGCRRSLAAPARCLAPLRARRVDRRRASGRRAITRASRSRSTAPRQARMFIVKDPDRLVLDLEDRRARTALEELRRQGRADDPYIKAVRVGANRPGVVRVVLDLKDRGQAAGLHAAAGRRVRPPPGARHLSAEPVDPLAALLERRPAASARRRGAAKARSAAEARPPRGRSEGRRALGRRIVDRSPGTAAKTRARIGRRGTREKDVTLAIARAPEGADRRRAEHARACSRATATTSCRCSERVDEGAQGAGRPVRLDPRRRFVRAATRAARRCSRCPSAAPPPQRRAGWRRRENDADLIGGVNLDGKDRT